MLMKSSRPLLTSDETLGPGMSLYGPQGHASKAACWAAFAVADKATSIMMILPHPCEQQTVFKKKKK